MPAKPKFDGVIEAAHYTPDGELQWVRTYERRGPAFGDHTILSKETLIARLQEGKRFVTGKRIHHQGTSFEVYAPVRLVKSGERIAIVAGEGNTLNVPRL